LKEVCFFPCLRLWVRERHEDRALPGIEMAAPNILADDVRDDCLDARLAMRLRCSATMRAILRGSRCEA
jgi:hypothetical protein